MSTTLQKHTALRAIKKSWDGTPVYAVKPLDGEECILLDSVSTLFHDLSSAIAIMQNMSRTLTADLDGVVQEAEFVPRQVFLAVALSDKRFSDFRKFVVGLLEELEDRGSVFSPDIADHPAMQQIRALADATARSIRAERIAADTAARQDRLERGQATLANDASEARRIAEAAHRSITYGGNDVPAVYWLSRRGVRVPEGAASKVGIECKDIAVSLGDNPDSRPKKPHGKYDIHHYPRDLMEKIGEIWMHRHRNHPVRCHWFS